MKVLDKTAPKWFQAASNNLSKIEANKAAYEDLEEGVKAPSDEIFGSVNVFLVTLSKNVEGELEEPRITVSPNGHIGLSFGGKKRSLDVLFTPKVHFYFKDELQGENSGNNRSLAAELAVKYFRL
jgi:hypothetical protein